jgi:RHS repeat-associated protein
MTARVISVPSDVTDNVYDNGSAGDGNLTQVTEHPGGGAADRVTQNFYSWRDRLVATKHGVQASENDGTHRPILFYEHDNLSQIVAVDQYDGDGVTITITGGIVNKPSASLLRAYSTSDYDDQGRIYGTHVFSVDQSSGAISSTSLNSGTWYDHRDNVIKTSQPGGLVTKTQYDGAGRAVKSFTTDGLGDAGWLSAGSVAGNNVLSQSETQYDADGNPILTIDRERFHDETATGALGDPNTTPMARVSYAASYYDAANRLIASVDVGTNGGTAYTRPASVPAASDTVLVTSTAYNSAGWVQSVTDPRGIITQTNYDNLGRTTKTIQAYTGGTPGNANDVATEYTYDGSGHTLTVKADLPGGLYQTTQYVYGVTTGSGSAINSNDVLAAMRYPDKTTGNPSSSQQETYLVNALGEQIQKTDRNGNVHAYSYDVLGRQTGDAVTTLGNGVDGSVLLLATAYDTGGRPYLYTSYNAATGGNVVNQVQQVYNGLSQLITEYQSTSGAVNTSSTPKVQYAYSQMAGGTNHSRLISMTYPNGRVLNYNYNAGLDGSISRLSSISDTSATLEQYAYLGLDTVVTRLQPAVKLTYVKQQGDPSGFGDGGDQYIGLDRFGRVVDQRWLNATTGAPTDRLAYGYHRDGNRLYRDNKVNAAFGELYHANGAANGYDNLGQLTGFARGTLSSSAGNGIPDTVASPSHSQSWALDALGNWTSVTTDGTTQTRSANQQNQITSISGQTTPGYDANGNMITDQTGKTLVFDAWNRLVQVKSGSTVLEPYTYDGLGRRVTVNPGTATSLYYSSAWQVLEEQSGGTTQAQYVWSPVYVDALIERDRGSERFYVQQDANYNVTAIVDPSGNVQERYIYDPYGQPTILTPTWGSRSGSSFSWVYLHQGGRYDNATGLYNFVNRDYSPALGRWVSMDPLRFGGGGPNFYQYVKNDPQTALDPAGLGDPDFSAWQTEWKSDSFDRVPALNRATIDKWHCKWKELYLEVYQGDGFTGDVNDIVAHVAHYYANFGIYISWHYTKVPTKGHWEAAAPPYGSDLPPIGGSYIPHQFSEYMRRVTYRPGTREGTGEWFIDPNHFGSTTPSVFFVRTIAKLGTVGPLWGPDVNGFTFDRTAIFIPQYVGPGSYPPYETVLAHELGHVLGLDHTRDIFGGSSLMKPFPAEGNELSGMTLSSDEVELIRNSHWLKPIPDPRPG